MATGQQAELDLVVLNLSETIGLLATDQRTGGDWQGN